MLGASFTSSVSSTIVTVIPLEKCEFSLNIIVHLYEKCFLVELLSLILLLLPRISKLLLTVNIIRIAVDEMQKIGPVFGQNIYENHKILQLFPVFSYLQILNIY